MTTLPHAALLPASQRRGFTRHSVLTAVLAVGGTFCFVAAALAAWPEPASAAQRPEAAAPQRLALAPARLRCETCGVIENIRHSESRDGAEAFYEFEVRLPDGSLRHSRDPQPGQWKVGERMQLLGGERTWSAY
jgi:hypothetical protein